MDRGAIINNKIQTYKLIIAYDGTKYYGWQKQDGGNAFIWIGGVADRLIRSFKNVFHKEISILGASRTDKGVHAQEQVARLRTRLDLDPTTIMRAWNYHLPSDITIKSVSKAPELFNPRKDVKQKTYTYRLFTEYPDPFIGRFGWLYPFIKKVNIDTLKEVLALYVGKHDFSSFCRYQEAISPIKTIDSIELIHEKASSPSLLITIKGPSFAHHQIRRMIGYALDVSRNRATALQTIQSLLDNPCHEQNLTKAGASGLTLQHIEYKDGTDS